MAVPAKNLFESMTRRRMSCPQVTQQLWDAIKSLRNTRQVPTQERVLKIMLKDFGVNEKEATRQLQYCVRDGLLEVTKRTVKKGTHAGSEQEWYNLPTLKLKTDEYDWYCFDCHESGDVICCQKPGCQKVYHMACISASEMPKDSFICHVCRMCQKSPNKFQMKRSKLNRLLGHPLAKLKSKYPVTLRDQRLPPPNKNILVSDRVAQALNPPALPAPDESEVWRTYLLIAREMNLTIVEEKIDRHRYRLLEEFYADCLNILHNMVIYNGVDSTVADLARQMVRDCDEDLKEIRQCVDCYKMSHGQKKQWFAKPCRNPHELVYAKPPGQAFWPAKVIKIEGDMYDVRLFGGQHTRMQLPKTFIRPISCNLESLQGKAKRPSAWIRACEELKKHQELLEKARLETRNFTVFVESSSSEESESVDSETERMMERDLRNAKVKIFIDKQTAASRQKQKGKRRRSSSLAPPGERKRGRPRLSESTNSALKLGTTSKTAGRPGRKRKEIYDSSDSLDSFSVGIEAAPKKNTDEIFDELLKSAPVATAAANGNEKAKKSTDAARRTQTRSKPPRKVEDLSEESKTKSDTMDSFTMSSVDTATTSGRRKALNFPSKNFSSEDSDSDTSSSAMRQHPSRSRSRLRRPIKPEGRPTKAKSSDEDDTSSSDSDSDLPKKGADKTNGKLDDSSSLSSDSDDSLAEPPGKKSLRSKTAARPAAPKVKTAAKNKPTDTSDSESLASLQATRSKPKDTSETTDGDLPAKKKPPSRAAAKKTAPPPTKTPPKSAEKPPRRTSQRNINKTEEKKNTANVEEESTDSETPLSAATNRKQSQNLHKKYVDKGDDDSSDSDSKSAKKDSDSDSDEDEKQKEPLNFKKVNPNQAGDEEKKGRGSKSDGKEEQKEKEETLVSSSSQEPVTCSVAVQTESFGRVANLPADIRPERLPDLEKELQIQAQTNRLLEMEFDKTKSRYELMLERLRSDHDDEVAELKARHLADISEIKKKQWCYNCELEAIYHCCWNTAYCSVDCQQAHWQSEHKRVCRRKR